MNVGGRDAGAMDQASLAAGADVQLHADVPLVALLGLVHLRVAALLLVLGRGRRGNQGGIDNSRLRSLGRATTQFSLKHIILPKSLL